MRSDRSLWFWRGVWGLGLLVGLAVWALYAWLPADGATGDLESFGPQGFRVQWLLEQREGALQVGDVILRAGGHTVDEWLNGAPRGPEWRRGGSVAFEILRDGQTMTLPIRLAPVPFGAILLRWAPQLIVALVYFCAGAFVFATRPHEMAARVMMLICLSVALQLWGDAYNFQYATLAWRWPFWFHLALEQLSYALTFASICHFTLIFPLSHPLLNRFPRLAPLALYAFVPMIVVIVLIFSPTWNAALEAGNRAAVAFSAVYILSSGLAGLRAARMARDPATRAQIHWLLWGFGVLLVVGGAGYILPLALTGRSLIPHPVAMLLLIVQALALVVAILRYNLFAIQVLINRTLVYGALSAALGLVFWASVALTQTVFRIVTGQKSDAAIVLSTLVIATLFQPLRRYLQAFIDRRFYRAEVDFRQAITSFSHEVRTLIELPELLHALTRRVAGLLHITHAAVLMRNAGGAFEPAGVYNLSDSQAGQLVLTEALLDRLQSGAAISRPRDRLFPLLIPLTAPQVGQGRTSQALLVGVLALGPRLSGQNYSLEDKALLAGLADQAGIAIHVARLNAEKQAEVQRREEAEARRHLAETLRALTVSLSSTLDLTEILERLLHSLAQIIPYASSAVMLIQEDCLRIVASRGLTEMEAVQRLRIPVAGDELFTQIMHTRQPVLIADARGDARVKRYAATDDVHGWIGVPLISKGEIIGVLTVDSQTPGAFGQQEAEIAFTFANQAAIAIENARLYGQVADRADELAQRARRLKLVGEISVAINQSKDLDAVLQTAVNGLAHVLEDVHVSQTGLALLDETREFLTVVAEHASPGSVRAIGTRIPVQDNPSMKRILATRAPLAIADAQNDPLLLPIRDIMTRRQVCSILITPLIVYDELIGSLGCDAIGSPHVFTAEEIELAQTVANLVAARIEQARLLNVERRRAGELDALRATMADISAELELSRLLQAVLVRAVRLLDATGGDLGLYHHTDQEILIVASHNMGRDYAGTRMALGDGAMGRVALTYQPLVIENYNTWEGRSSAYTEGPWYGVMAAPLMVGKELVGAIGIVDSEPRRKFTPSDLNLLSLFANQAAIAVKNARLFEAAQREIAERVRAEAARQALIAELEAKNAELERFTYTVSHDLKSPLITIQGFLGFLEQAALAGDVEQVKADIGRISNAASKMQKLLEDLLELSRIGRVVNAPQAVPLGELAHETVGLLAGQLMERGVEVVIAADLPVVYGDRPRLLEVLQNLVENAVKYMGEQPRPSVEIGLRYHDDEPVFFVRDNGIGIEPRYHERVFDLFARLDQKSTGTGVGLAIVKRIVEVHGGRIWVESEGVGEGSTFCFTLPDSRELTRR